MHINQPCTYKLHSITLYLNHFLLILLDFHSTWIFTASAIYVKKKKRQKEGEKILILLSFAIARASRTMFCSDRRMPVMSLTLTRTSLVRISVLSVEFRGFHHVNKAPLCTDSLMGFVNQNGCWIFQRHVGNYHNDPKSFLLRHISRINFLIDFIILNHFCIHGLG